MQRRTAYFGLAIAAASVAAIASQWPQPPTERATTADVVRQPIAPPLSAFPDRLPRREAIPYSGDALFGARHKPVPPAPPPTVNTVVSPTVPTPPYRFVGSMTYENRLQHLLAQGDAVFPVSQGETIGGAYRVEAVDAEKITLRYVPLDTTVDLPLVAHAEASRGPGASPTPGPIPPQEWPVAPRISPIAEPTAPSDFRGMRAAQLRGPRNQPNP